MKKIFFLIIVQVYFLLTFSLKSQSTDSTANYFAYYYYMMEKFEQDAQNKGVNYWEVDGWQQFIRWKHDHENRYDENGDLTSYASALKNYYNNVTDITPETVPTWEYIGHDSIYPRLDGTYNSMVGQGNISKVWVDENNIDLIVVGGNDGNVWRTSNGGNDWFCISDTEPLINGVRSLEVSPSDTNKIYIAQGTGGYSNGLFYTEDGGISWTNIYNMGSFSYPNASAENQPRKWIINPINDSIMFLLK
jgi:hypothetical protein